MTTSRPSRMPASPRHSGRAPRSPRSPRTCARTRAPTPEVPAEHRLTDPDALVDAALAGDRRALARILTAVENRTPVAEAALRRLYPLAGTAHLVGITGPPGSGKSTLVAALIGAVRAAGRSV